MHASCKEEPSSCWEPTSDVATMRFMSMLENGRLRVNCGRKGHWLVREGRISPSECPSASEPALTRDRTLHHAFPGTALGAHSSHRGA